jgi:hypothetical protein
MIKPGVTPSCEVTYKSMPKSCDPRQSAKQGTDTRKVAYDETYERGRTRTVTGEVHRHVGRLMTDVGIIIGSGIYELPVDQEPRMVENRFGEAELAIFRVGRWTVGGISRHGKGHHHLPHTIPIKQTS